MRNSWQDEDIKRAAPPPRPSEALSRPPPTSTMLTATLLPSLICLSALALANPLDPVLVARSPVSLSLSRRLNLNSTGAHNLVEHAIARARAFKARGTNSHSESSAKRAISQPLTNQAVSYVASVDVGSPPTSYQLLVDTGSSNTWVGGSKPYTSTSTSHDTGESVSVTYGSGNFTGKEVTDQVSLGHGLTIHNQSIGVASSSEGLDGLDGILGIGPTDLTQGTLSPSSQSTIPTVTDTLYTQRLISANEIGVSFEPTTTSDNENGEITWGGTNHLKYIGFITYIPISTTSPAKFYWGIDQSVRYGPSTVILSTTAGIVDTGTTLIGLATDAFDKYRDATGSTLDENVGLLSLPNSKYSSLKSLYFTAGGRTFELVPNAQIWPRALNSDIGGTAYKIYLIVSDLKSPSGQGLDFINGLTFLERYYSVYDTQNKRVGLAQTLWTSAEVN